MSSVTFVQTIERLIREELKITTKMKYDIQSPSNAYKRSPVYAMKPATFNMIFHNVRVQPCRWGLMCEKIQIRGFLKCKIHCCSLNDFKNTNPQTLRTPGIEPGPPEDNRFTMQNDDFIGLNAQGAFFWGGAANFDAS